ncbi:MAG: IS21 family transposase [Selenomonadaceae bacterium]|nr:IS21 family transposase [Selenomonadaceae bacterium]
MLDYKDIIIKRYALQMSGREIAAELGVSKSGVNDFLKAFENSEKISYPLPEGITNYGIAALVYGIRSAAAPRDISIEMPDFEDIDRLLHNRKNMTLVFLWGRYKNRCNAEGLKFYSYRQFCELYNKWCEENAESLHLNAVIGQKIEVDFAGKTFEVIDRVTGEVQTVVVFVAVLPYSQYIYAEGMLSTKEPQWIEVNNHMLKYFEGAAPLVVCDNCKQAVIANKDWIEPELNKDYAEWAEHNGTVILPAKVRKPRFKGSVENAVGILEKGFFHDLEERRYFSLEAFNEDLWVFLQKLNHNPLKGQNSSRHDRFMEEKQELLPLPEEEYHFMERKTVKVSSDYHVRFDNAYYSVPRQYIHKQVQVRATASVVKIYDQAGELLWEGPRATRKGQWVTTPEHLPKSYSGYAEWNSTYFIQKALTVGSRTAEVIRRVLKSRPYEVQTYRSCVGILYFANKYSKSILEECCSQALDLNKVTYTFIKNSIPAIAAERMSDRDRRKLNDEKNKGAYVMGPEASDLSRLLAKSQALADEAQKGGEA